MLLMRDEHADDSDDEVGAGELRHEETGEVYSIVYEGQGKKFKVTGACATCISRKAAGTRRLTMAVRVRVAELEPETTYQFFVATPMSEGGMQGPTTTLTTASDEEPQDEPIVEESESESESEGSEGDGVGGEEGREAGTEDAGGVEGVCAIC